VQEADLERKAEAAEVLEATGYAKPSGSTQVSQCNFGRLVFRAPTDKKGKSLLSFNFAVDIVKKHQHPISLEGFKFSVALQKFLGSNCPDILFPSHAETRVSVRYSVHGIPPNSL